MCAVLFQPPLRHFTQCNVTSSREKAEAEGGRVEREGRMEAWDGSLVVYSVLRSVALHAFQQRDLGPRSLA